MFRLETMALYKSTLGSLNSVPGLKPQRQGARLNSIRSRSLNPTSWEETDISKWPLVPGAPTMAISTRGRLAVKDIVSVSLYCKKSVTLRRAILSLFFACEHAAQKHMKRVDGERIDDQEAIDKYTTRYGSRGSVWINIGPPRQPEGRMQNLVPPVCRADWSVPWLQTRDIIGAAREKRYTPNRKVEETVIKVMMWKNKNWNFDVLLLMYLFRCATSIFKPRGFRNFFTTSINLYTDFD